MPDSTDGMLPQILPGLCKCTKQNCPRRCNTKVPTSHKGRGSDNNPPRIIGQTLPRLKPFINVANLPDPINSRVDQSHSTSIDASHSRFDPASASQHAPNTHRSVHKNHAGNEDTKIRNECSGNGWVSAVSSGETAQKDSEIEIWSWEGLGDGEAD
ncbi:hypothetical protein HG530_010500 [Fusarium avenaceum]|nr:hypothetical protein HG530_010500 [Fusarium avenaceum]